MGWGRGMGKGGGVWREWGVCSAHVGDEPRPSEVDGVLAQHLVRVSFRVVS